MRRKGIISLCLNNNIHKSIHPIGSSFSTSFGAGFHMVCWSWAETASQILAKSHWEAPLLALPPLLPRFVASQLQLVLLTQSSQPRQSSSQLVFLRYVEKPTYFRCIFIKNTVCLRLELHPACAIFTLAESGAHQSLYTSAKVQFYGCILPLLCKRPLVLWKTFSKYHNHKIIIFIFI